mmetsp:Transcript_134030/g.347142  ORF Transcript_134030/g.347142 Transcript_134030/m.347142 type:complete len:253 (-) Transcript_134030:40-798(-)
MYWSKAFLADLDASSTYVFVGSAYGSTSMCSTISSLSFSSDVSDSMMCLGKHSSPSSIVQISSINMVGIIIVTRRPVRSVVFTMICEEMASAKYRASLRAHVLSDKSVHLLPATALVAKSTRPSPSVVALRCGGSKAQRCSRFPSDMGTGKVGSDEERSTKPFFLASAPGCRGFKSRGAPRFLWGLDVSKVGSGWAASSIILSHVKAGSLHMVSKRISLVPLVANLQQNEENSIAPEQSFQGETAEGLAGCH